MNLVSKEGDVCYFAIEHKKEYQQAQIAFWNAVDTMEAQSISVSYVEMEKTWETKKYYRKQRNYCGNKESIVI